MTPLDHKYQSLNGPTGLLGMPYSEELPCPDGIARYRNYDLGTIHWHPRLGAFETHGAIRDRWSQTGWERGLLGYPVSDEQDWTAHDLYNMLPTNYLTWFFPAFGSGHGLPRP